MKNSILSYISWLVFFIFFGFGALVSAQSRVTVSGTPNPSTGGSIAATSNSSSATCSGNSCQIDPGSTVTLLISMNNGFRFVAWSGGTGCTGTNKSVTITATSSVSCTANFVRMVTVTGTANPTAGGTVAASSISGGATCNGTTCVTDIGGNVSLFATVNNGYRFIGWNGGSASCTGATNPLSITAVSDIRCVANFVKRLIVRGTVSGAPAGTTIKASSPNTTPQADCSGSSCTVDLDVNVTLTAPAIKGLRLISWIGAGCTEPISDGNPNTLALGKISTNLSCTALYQ